LRLRPLTPTLLPYTTLFRSPKDNKYAGTMMDGTAFGDNLAEIKRPVIFCPRKFTRYGQSGIPVSEWFPNLGSVIDEIAIVRSMRSEEHTSELQSRVDLVCRL